MRALVALAIWVSVVLCEEGDGCTASNMGACSEVLSQMPQCEKDDKSCHEMTSDPCHMQLKYGRCLQGIGCAPDMYQGYFEMCQGAQLTIITPAVSEAITMPVGIVA